MLLKKIVDINFFQPGEQVLRIFAVGVNSEN